MGVSKRDNLSCELHIGDVKIKKMWKFNNLGIIATVGRMCNTNVHRNSKRCLSEMDQSIKDLENVLRNKEKNAEQLCNIFYMAVDVRQFPHRLRKNLK